MDSENHLGAFLRVRRQLLDPGDAGVSVLGRRRVPGLRREEVAARAGVSADYYTRLEQGRSQHPSEQVVHALARALALDADATAHLHHLARRAHPSVEPVLHAEEAPPGVLELLDAWRSPAFVVGRLLDVLGANALARELSPMHAVGANLLRTIFLDPRAADLHPDRLPFGERLVATLRASVVGTEDPRLAGLVAELSSGSDDFRRLWGEHLVRARGDGVKRFAHPALGAVELAYRTFAVNGPDAAGQTVVAYYAAPGAASDEALAALRARVARGEAAPDVRPPRRTAP